MPWFLVTAEVTVGCYTKIEADDDGEALKIARGLRDSILLAPEGAPGSYDWTDGLFVVEPDGTALKFRVEKTEDPEGEN